LSTAAFAAAFLIEALRAAKQENGFAFSATRDGYFGGL